MSKSGAKKNKSVYIAFATIAIVSIIFGFLNARTLDERLSLQESATISIKSGGEEIGTLTMKEIQDLGLKDFKANLKRNGKEPIEYTYTGVLLRDAIQSLDISLDGKSHIEAKAVDGYTSAISIEKILEDDNVYIAIMREGKPLKGREEDGPGPYQIIISKDKFSQYWCKWAIEVNIQ